MAEASIPVDLFNPGQVFACIGFLEAADIIIGDATGAFDWHNQSDTRFRLRAKGIQNPVEIVLKCLSKARVYSTAPVGIKLSTQSWNVSTKTLTQNEPYPFPVPESPATLPTVLSVHYEEKTFKLSIEHYGEVRQITGRDNVKFWAGAGGYPGAALARDALDLVREQCCEAVNDPLNLSAEQSSSFRFDWRRDYIPIDIGFSLNKHAKDRFITVGFPLVEIFAAIGLTNARPYRLDKLKYRYGVLGIRGTDTLFEPCFLRAALGASKTSRLPFSQRTFKMQLGWPGQENQARCITTITEETNL